MVLFVYSFLTERNILFVSKIAIFVFKRRVFDGTETEKNKDFNVLFFHRCENNSVVSAVHGIIDDVGGWSCKESQSVLYLVWGETSPKYLSAPALWATRNLPDWQHAMQFEVGKERENIETDKKNTHEKPRDNT